MVFGVSFICTNDAAPIINGRMFNHSPRNGMVNGSCNNLSGSDRSVTHDTKGACLISKEF